MEPLLDLTKEYGLVLDGGGARGAYQIGAWTALEEAGVKVCAVAGTSVGALKRCSDLHGQCGECTEDLGRDEVFQSHGCG